MYMNIIDTFYFLFQISGGPRRIFVSLNQMNN